MKVIKKIPFWQKMLILGAIPLALLGIVVGLLSYRQAAKVVTQSQRKVLSDTINRIDININVKARQINSFMQTVAESEPAKELIRWSEAGGAVAPETEELELFCSNTFASFAEVNSINVFLGEKRVYCSDAMSASRFYAETLGELYSAASNYRGRVIWSSLSQSLFEGEEQPRGRMLIYSGLYGECGEARGLLVLELDPAVLGNAILTKQKILSYQTTFLTDRDGNVIYSDNSVPKEWRSSVLQSYNMGARRRSLELDGEEYYVCSQYNGLTSWVTHSMIPNARLFPGAETLRSYIFALVIVSVALASMFLLIFSIAVTKPLERLNKGMKEVQDKNFELQLANDRGDEIGELTDSFNYMVNKINILVNQVYQEKLAQKNAELEALQTQINPHFLYNTLDCLNWMLIDKEETEISAVIVALGKLMQYSMDTSESMVTLRSEYNNVRDYLMIQKTRLEERLDFRLELEEEAADFCVPKLLLQPLVENAIKHGIEPSGRCGAVIVESRRDGSNIQICVRDNGMGMDELQLEQYKELLKSDKGSHTSIGVRNVARRLQLHFGDNCSFCVDSHSQEGMSITICLPVGRTGEVKA